MAKPPVVADLRWTEGLRFDVASARIITVVDGDSTAGASPVQMLVIALAGCMAADVVDIVRKGRHALTGFRASIVAERAPEPPARILSAQLRFELDGNVPSPAVERAIALSRDKYCSVWHSLRQDILLTTSFTITP
ncbi:MAG TPA: OsmC family protein [Vicinamibacterales bacterium]|jgi:putative redox protein